MTTNDAQLNELAKRYNVSLDTVNSLLDALKRGNGTMAQFNIRELGGQGQWMKGGMTMAGDMNDHDLKNRINGLCSALAPLAEKRGSKEPAKASEAASEQHHAAQSSGDWWPDDLGSPDSSGSQNDMRYAVFGAKQRLAVERNGRVTVYDTGDHRVSGVSQSQGGKSSLAFTSQSGNVNLDDLRKISG